MLSWVQQQPNSPAASPLLPLGVLVRGFTVARDLNIALNRRDPAVLHCKTNVISIFKQSQEKQHINKTLFQAMEYILFLEAAQQLQLLCSFQIQLRISEQHPVICPLHQWWCGRGLSSLCTASFCPPFCIPQSSAQSQGRGCCCHACVPSGTTPGAGSQGGCKIANTVPGGAWRGFSFPPVKNAVWHAGNVSKNASRNRNVWGLPQNKEVFHSQQCFLPRSSVVFHLVLWTIPAFHIKVCWDAEGGDGKECIDGIEGCLPSFLLLCLLGP